MESSDSKYVLGMSVDFMGAFDNLEWVRVIEKLERVKCVETALWKSYFQGSRYVWWVGMRLYGEGLRGNVHRAPSAEFNDG